MRIAINTRFLLSSRMEGFGWFTFETVKRMVEAHPEHEFIFFFDRSFDEKFIFGSNVTPVVLSPQARHPILFKIWFNISVTRALKKYKADIFFSPDGYLSLKTNLPQVAAIHDINFEHLPEDTPKSPLKYLKKFFPLFARKANQIITVSEYSKEDILKTYGIDESKITVAFNGASDLFKPLDENGKQNSKARFADGNEYFVFVGSLHPRKNVQRLLEGFEIFKAQSGSPTKLVIVGEKLWKDNSIEDAYYNNKFKEEIHFTGHLPIEDLTKAVGGAKALVFPSYFEGFGIPLVEAMKCGVPICCGNLTSLPEVAGDAALYFDPYSVDEIAQSLSKIDSDSSIQKNLSENGLRRSTQFSWDKSADIIWDVIATCAESSSN